MSEKHNKYFSIIIVALLSICAISLSVLLFSFLNGKTEGGSAISGSEATPPVSSEAPTGTPTPQEQAEKRAQNERASVISILSIIDKQQTVEDGIRAEVESGLYSFENPLSVTNPYGISPLTALIGFTSSEPVQISVSIRGKDEKSTFSFDFDGYNTTHYIPIYGLYQNFTNFVTLTATNKDGEIVNEKTHEITTEALPEPYSTLILQTNIQNPDAYADGLNFTTQHIKSAYDINGDFRWALTPSFLLGGTFDYTNGHMLLSTGANHMGDTIFVEINYLGKIFATYYSPYGSHHHIETLPSGNFLVTGSNGETVEDFLYEIDIRNGLVSNTIDYKTILQRMRKLPSNVNPNTNSQQSLQANIDWLHLNATTYDEATDSLIISSNMQSAVVKHDYDTNEIDWILSDPEGWANMYEQYLLTPIGENFEYSYGQHLPQILPDYDENPDTVDILLFDNGRGRFLYDEDLLFAIENGTLTPPEEYSRMVHYRIDEVNMTVEQIWQYGKEYGNELYSVWGGSAFLLPNNNRLGLFSVSSRGADVYYPHALEVDENGELVWEAMLHSKSATGQFGENRLERRDIYNESANSLGIGEEIKDFIPDPIWQKYNFQR